MPSITTTRTWHRRLSILVGLQLLLWTTSGLIFSWDPIERVRGEDALAEPAGESLAAGRLVSLSVAADTAGVTRLEGASLTAGRGGWLWVLHDDEGARHVVDALAGGVAAELSSEEAADLARGRFLPAAAGAAVTGVRRVAVADGEYRHKPVPALRVDFDDGDETHLYLDALTGEVTAVRHDLWRRFDFFWMLHIMDYADRTDFGTPWLKLFALLGVATSLSGLVLAVQVLRQRRSSTE